jgi:hypothetical protein
MRWWWSRPGISTRKECSTAKIVSTEAIDPILIGTGNDLQLTRASPYLTAHISELLDEDGALVVVVGDDANSIILPFQISGSSTFFLHD